MDIKCNFNPYSLRTYKTPYKYSGITFSGACMLPPEGAGKAIDIVIKRPADVQNAAGLLSSNHLQNQSRLKKFLGMVKNYANNYVKNIKHTYEHKVVYSLVEKELFGKNSINSLTHDADKMIMYCLGFPKSFVSKFHRKHSAHHPSSGKKMNLKSMLCDNIASSPEFKPEKKKNLREHFNSSEELKNVRGLKEILEKYNYGENLDFKKIIFEKTSKYYGIKGFARAFNKIALFGLF